jgi:hypothetical protein
MQDYIKANSDGEKAVKYAWPSDAIEKKEESDKISTDKDNTKISSDNYGI